MDDYRPAKLFTPEEANAALPLVRAIVRDLAGLSCEVADRRARLAALLSSRNSDELDQADPYSAELAQIQDELDNDTRQLQEYVRELRDLGVEPKNGPEGLVDFPAEMDGRIVYLCWKLGEPEVLHWHELEAGFAGRQPLTAGSVAGSAENGDIDDVDADAFGD
ncbi:MAG: DUF2203 domain-containing protein [Planctomycetales bacterium]|nr:DUF2203 domain-containing protein [Planctomycetales bacterium]